MKIASTLGILLLIAAHGFCQEKEFEWLIGKWKITGKDVYETWTRADDGSLAGLSFKVTGSDTVFTEEIKLVYYGGTYHYVPDVAGPQGPIDFRITLLEADGFVAENPHHDFPTLIRYRHLAETSGRRIEASIEGGGKVVLYNYERVE